MKKIFTISRSCVFFAVLSSCGPDSETTKNSALSSEPMSAFYSGPIRQDRKMGFLIKSSPCLVLLTVMPFLSPTSSV